MGATASINYAATRKYKPSEPIEVKFDKVVKYDDGDEKPFRGWCLVFMVKQVLLLTCLLNILFENAIKNSIFYTCVCVLHT